MKYEEFNNRFAHLYKPIQDFHQKSLPLCAAENALSDFVKLPLTSFIQEKYILGGVSHYEKDNFIGSEKLYKIYNLLNEMCTELFHCKYADGRTLTGVNTISTLLMSLFEANDTIYISSEAYGGHSSMPKICKRLGINTIEMPYDYANMDFNYSEINKTLSDGQVKGILICLSDILFQPDLTKLNLTSDIFLIYDATQLLGLIAAQKLVNFLELFPTDIPLIVAGSTHKTLPGPATGLILSNSKRAIDIIDNKINPDYLRNVQLHQLLSLVFCLQEFSLFGKQYSDNMVDNANLLAELLNKNGFDIVNKKGLYTTTHQIFLKFDKHTTHEFFMRCQLYNITLNERYKKIYEGSGIRIGTQQIARYGWGEEEITEICNILNLVLYECQNNSYIYSQDIIGKIQGLSQKKIIKYNLPAEMMKHYFE